MGQVHHGSATTTAAVRRAIQHSQESLRALAKRYGINQKTVAKWKKRTSVADLPTGPREPKSTVLSIEDEAVIVAFRRYTLLPLDDCLYALQPNQLFHWRKLAAQGALTATRAEGEVVAASEYRALQNQVRELQRLLGKKTMEAEILKDALEAAAGSKKQMLRSLSWPNGGSR
ncbi:hypothetical protein GCM10023069_08610 [Shinella granuli]|uniref:Transposase n=1 Tax=Shinella granuli TaxID=323621 RepID=A0A4R2BZU3_SHIGR|nr:transposase [Shinella granuli]